MSTIPITSKEVITTYTTLGGKAKSHFHKYLYPISIVLLNRGPKFNREEALEELKEVVDYEVILINGPEPAADLATLVKKHPQVKFILLKNDCSPGEKVNIGIAEAQAPLVCVLHTDMHIPQQALSSRLLEKIALQHVLCTLPVLKNRRLETIPSLQVPVFIKKRLKPSPFHPLHDGMKSLFPFDYVGIYNKERFRFSGGYDPVLGSPYWQKLDFGLRAALWGEELLVNVSFFFQYRSEVPIEDSTPNESYKLFYLKNLALDYRRDQAILGWRRFPHYFFASGTSLLKAFKEFKAARRWVRHYRYRFKTDFQRLVATWPTPS